MSFIEFLKTYRRMEALHKVYEPQLRALKVDFHASYPGLAARSDNEAQWNQLIKFAEEKECHSK